MFGYKSFTLDFGFEVSGESTRRALLIRIRPSVDKRQNESLNITFQIPNQSTVFFFFRLSGTFAILKSADSSKFN